MLVSRKLWLKCHIWLHWGVSSATLTTGQIVLQAFRSNILEKFGVITGESLEEEGEYTLLTLLPDT